MSASVIHGGSPRSSVPGTATRACVCEPGKNNRAGCSEGLGDNSEQICRIDFSIFGVGKFVSVERQWSIRKCSDTGSVDANLAGPPIAGSLAVCSSGGKQGAAQDPRWILIDPADTRMCHLNPFGSLRPVPRDSFFTVTASCANRPTWRSAPSGKVRAAVDSAVRTDFQNMRQSESHDSHLLLALPSPGYLPVAPGRSGRSVDPECHCRTLQRQAPALHR